MGPFEFVVVLVMIVVVAICVVAEQVGGVFTKKVGGDKQQELDKLITTVERLEQRMQVVEEIVSSKSFNLRQQIDDLQGEK